VKNVLIVPFQSCVMSALRFLEVNSGSSYAQTGEKFGLWLAAA
jgi:hypothetical protein